MHYDAERLSHPDDTSKCRPKVVDGRDKPGMTVLEEWGKLRLAK
jgi:hypothetical protein